MPQSTRGTGPLPICLQPATPKQHLGNASSNSAYPGPAFPAAPPAKPQNVLSCGSSISREHHWTPEITWFGKPALSLQGFSTGRSRCPHMERRQPSQATLQEYYSISFLSRIWDVERPCLKHYQPNRARGRQLTAGEPKLLTLN